MARLVIIHTLGYLVKMGSLCVVREIHERDGDCNAILEVKAIAGPSVGAVDHVDAGCVSPVHEYPDSRENFIVPYEPDLWWLYPHG